MTDTVSSLFITVQKTFAFASEQKALEKIRGFERKIDAAALYEYLTFQNILSDRTLNEYKDFASWELFEFLYQQGLQQASIGT